MKGDYAGWTLEAIECGLVHPPIGDMESDSQKEGMDSGSDKMEDGSTPPTISMW